MSVNLAALVGNSALRIDALGWDDVPADERALDRMRGLLREAMEAGAFGLSSGLDYPPGCYATTAELAALTREAARLGGFYHTHVRYPLGDRFLDPFREAIEIGETGEGPVHITHFYRRATAPGPAEAMIELVTDARARGLDVTWDTYPSEWASTRLLIMLPPWVQAGGPDSTLERLADRGVRDQLRDDLAARGVAYAGVDAWNDLRLGYLSTPAYRDWDGRTLGELMAFTGGDVVDVVCDLLIAEDLRPNQVTPRAGARLADAVHRASAVDDRHGLDVHRVAAVAADVGLVPARAGRVRARGTRADAGGGRAQDDRRARRPPGADGSRVAARRDGRGHRRVRPGDRPVHRHLRAAALVPRGIPFVVVNGVVVVDGGEHTGALPGRALRRH